MTTDHFQFNAVTTKVECGCCGAEVKEGFIYNDDQIYCDLDCLTSSLFSIGKIEEFEVEE